MFWFVFPCGVLASNDPWLIDHTVMHHTFKVPMAMKVKKLVFQKVSASTRILSVMGIGHLCVCKGLQWEGTVELGGFDAKPRTWRLHDISR